MKEYLTFDDVLIKPKFSNVKSRKDVDLSTTLTGSLPVLSANMDTVCGPDMAIAMAKAGALGVLHRFWSISENTQAYLSVKAANYDCAISVGVGEQEQIRVHNLYSASARIFVLDVAHGAQKQVVNMYHWMKDNFKDIFCIVGNFATAESCSDFWVELNQIPSLKKYNIDAFKIGIGGGSACTSRIKTGCGIPQLAAVMEVAEAFKKHIDRPLIICDGGMRTSGDIAKALGAGADLVMLGSMLAGTDESPGEKVYALDNTTLMKRYRGSASKESYKDQNKEAQHRTAEGEAFWIDAKGPVAQVLQDIEGGLRSALTYVGARNIKEFQEKVEFVKITTAGRTESLAHGKKD